MSGDPVWEGLLAQPAQRLAETIARQEDVIFKADLSIMRLMASVQRLFAEVERLSALSPLDAAQHARKVLAAEQALLIREATLRGMSIAEIQKTLKVSKSTVERARRSR